MLVHAVGTIGSHARSSWCLIGYVLLLGAACTQFRIVNGDCWYDNQRHEENSEVPTGEPCLNCTCSRSVLLCYLRVCPKLPNPPPPGCILLHRYKTCCPELICSDFYDGGNSIEARSEPEGGMDLPSDDQSAYENACISNGSIYGPGSAMHSSSLCEYCYCLAGKQICVKPKCLLPIDDCNPIYEDTSCCPVRYNCTVTFLEENNPKYATTTVISTSTTVQPKDGCLVDGTYHSEGSKVIGVGHSVCDNCYCLRSILRCEPLSCAPPLLGCTPMVKPGECCAASYNCNGTLDIDPEPNYGLFPTISKEYSKLRKEVHRNSPTKQKKDGVVTVEPFYVLAETLQDPSTKFVYQRSPDTYGTTRHFSGAYFSPSSTQEPTKEIPTSEENFYSSSKQKPTTSKPVDKHKTVPGVYYATTNYEFQNKNYKRVYSTTLRSHERSLPTKSRAKSTVPPAETKEDSADNSDYLGFENLNIFSIVDSLLDGKLYRKIENQSEIEQKQDNDTFNVVETTKRPVQTYLKQTTESTNLPTNSTTDIINTSEMTLKTSNETDATESTTVIAENEIESTSVTEAYITTTLDDQNTPITLRSILKSTDCINNIEHILEKDNENIEATKTGSLDPAEINNLAETKTEFLTTTDFDTDVSSSENFLTEETGFSDISLRNKVNVEASNLSPNMKVILNISKHKIGDDFDYDYNEPTLPPSLPNLKIIPFVAADALDSRKEIPKEPTPVYIDKKMDDAPFEFNFSPPMKTEGGFVPKEPPILDTFYDNIVPAPSLFNEPNENPNVNCNSNGQEVHHGMSVSSDSPCMTCTCFYGNIVCQKPNCPPPRSGCTKVVEQEASLCCPNYNCDEPSLSLLDSHDNMPQEIVTVAEGIIPPDPFKDVIRTEAAPNLQSLMGDKMSFQRTTTIISTLTPFVKDSSTSNYPTPEATTAESIGSFGLEDVFKFIFSGGSPDISEKPTHNETLHPIYGKKVEAKNHSDSTSTESIKLPEDTRLKNDSSVVLKIPSKYDTTAHISRINISTITKIDHERNDSNTKFDLTTTTNKRTTTNSHFDVKTNDVEVTDKSTNQKNINAYNKDSNNVNPNNKNSNFVGVGLLKLAGCNIYGRMYRVGRIISELSGPCLECKCTDVGVQCTPLKC